MNAAPLPLHERLKQQAHALGFELAGVAPAAPADGFAHLQDWLAQGFAGAMDYLHRNGPPREHPRSILPEVRSIVMVGLNYSPGPVDEPPPLHGKVARYAGGADYHDVLRDKLKALLRWVQAESPGTRGRAVVDTAPLLERDFARRAGLGWFGKNTMLIHKRLGSYFLLGGLLLDLELPADEPFATQHCGSCTRCLDACPTDAFTGPYQLDARRCISYLTIELRGPVPDDLRSGVGDWLFGCDVCQEVCPWNRKAPVGAEALLQPTEAGLHVDLIELLSISEAEFRARFKHTPLWRTGRSGLLRNAALVLGNQGCVAAIPALEKAAHDADPLVSEAACWAREQLKNLPGEAK